MSVMAWVQSEPVFKSKTKQKAGGVAHCDPSIVEIRTGVSLSLDSQPAWPA